MIKKILLLVLLSPFFLYCQDSMTGEFSPKEDFDFAILYRLTPTGKIYAQDTKIGNDGKLKLNFDSLSKGSYRLVYNLTEENNYFDFIYDENEEVSFTFSETTGVVFTDSQNKILNEYLKEIDAIENALNSELTSESPNTKDVKTLLRKQIDIQNRAENESKNSFASLFVKANKPYIPNDFKNRSLYYGEKKTNFFSNFDFEDMQLQSSSFPLKIIEKYYEEFTLVQGSTFYRSLINDIYFEIKNSDSEFQKTVLAGFWQSLVDKNKNNAANYLADNYLTDLATSHDDTVLIKKLDLFKNLSVGAKVPNFSWEDENDNENTLYSTDVAEYYVLAFWSSDCPHCMEQMPILNEKMKTINSNKIKVIAVGLEMEDEPWKQTTEQLSNFIHVLRKDEDRAAITLDYNVTGTPTYFVLDKDKKIIGKPQGQNTLFSIIDTLEAYKKQ